MRPEEIEPAYYDSRAWLNTTWMGVPCQKYAQDLLVLAEILHAVRPALVIEFGTAAGGSTLFMAHVMEAYGFCGEIISVDQSDAWERPKHHHIRYIKGSTRDPAVLAEITRAAAGGKWGPVLIDHDADHSAAAVRKDLNDYARLVTPGSYFIVEDTNTGRPGTSVEDFVRNNAGEWEVDRARERLGLTMHPGGYLRRKK